LLFAISSSTAGPADQAPESGVLLDDWKALGLLKAYSFVTQMANSKFINMHRLVHLATRNWLRSEKLMEDWTIKIGDFLSGIFPSHHHDYRVLWREYLPHAQFTLQSQEYPKGKLERESLCEMVALCLSADGRYNDAETLFKEVLEKRAKRLKEKDPKMFKSMADLASTFWNQG
jgi:hypothetical protein